MSSRLAHRPRYRNMRQFVQSSRSLRQKFSRTGWTYRSQKVFYEKRVLGYGLSLLPLGRRLAPHILAY